MCVIMAGNRQLRIGELIIVSSVWHCASVLLCSCTSVLLSTYAPADVPESSLLNPLSSLPNQCPVPPSSASANRKLSLISLDPVILSLINLDSPSAPTVAACRATLSSSSSLHHPIYSMIYSMIMRKTYQRTSWHPDTGLITLWIIKWITDVNNFYKKDNYIITIIITIIIMIIPIIIIPWILFRNRNNIHEILVHETMVRTCRLDGMTLELCWIWQ